jgi:hypothetical protein
MENKNKKVDLIPAIPPEDYKGSVGKWMIALQERSLWNGENPDWHGNVEIPSDVWWKILEECESKTFK